MGNFRFQSDRFGDWSETARICTRSSHSFCGIPRAVKLVTVVRWTSERLATIVLVGSEGELRVLGDTLEEFLGLLATGKTGEG